MRWLTNMYDPSKPDAWMYVTPMLDETYEQAMKRQEHYLTGKIIDKPKATEKWTVEQLEAMGEVGVYVND